MYDLIDHWNWHNCAVVVFGDMVTPPIAGKVKHCGEVILALEASGPDNVEEPHDARYRGLPILLVTVVNRTVIRFKLHRDIYKFDANQKDKQM